MRASHDGSVSRWQEGTCTSVETPANLTMDSISYLEVTDAWCKSWQKRHGYSVLIGADGDEEPAGEPSITSPSHETGSQRVPAAGSGAADAELARLPSALDDALARAATGPASELPGVNHSTSEGSLKDGQAHDGAAEARPDASLVFGSRPSRLTLRVLRREVYGPASSSASSSAGSADGSATSHSAGGKLSFASLVLCKPGEDVCSLA